MEERLLKIDNLVKKFNDTAAVDGVSFAVKKGEIFGLLGPNGAGKTTLIRIIMDIFKADQGTISMGGEVETDKSQIGYLPEERGVYEQTKVLETIVYFANLKGMSKQEAKAEAVNWLKKFGLEKYKDSKIEELSKGMKQKIQFIIAIVHKPVLLVLDELFSGLDPVNQKLFKQVVEELADQGITILLSSHRMNLVEELCNRIFMINNGRQVLYGELETIKDEFGGKRVMIAAENKLEMLKDKSYIKNLAGQDNKYRFELTPEITPRELIADLPAEIEIKEFSILNPPLYDIFLQEAEGVANDEE